MTDVTDDMARGGSEAPLHRRKVPVVSAALLLVTAALFLYSFRGSVKTFDAGRCSAWVWRGELMLRLFSAEPITGDAQQVSGWRFVGLGAYRMTHVTGSSYSVVCPLWLLLIAFGVAPAREAIRLMRMRRTERRSAAP
jgi:hypothetical protein